MAAEDAIQSVGGFIKVPSISGSSVLGFFAYIIAFMLFLIIVGVIIYFVIQRVKFKYKVIVFERINGQFQPTKKDRGMFMKHGRAGDQVFYLKKMKRYLPNPSYQTGKNTFWFWLREDQELINFSPGDYDEQARELGARFLDKEMRYARTSLQETFKERYIKPSFFATYGQMIVNIAAFAIIGVFLFLIVRELVGAIGAVEGLVNAAKEVNQASRDLLVSMDNICGSGSGIQ